MASVYSPLATMNALNVATPDGFEDVNFDYAGSFPLTALQALPNQVINIDTDADFVWRALILLSTNQGFTIQFATSQDFYLSNSPILASNVVQSMIAPEITFPAGGAIRLDLVDISGAGQALMTIICRGVKRYTKLVR